MRPLALIGLVASLVLGGVAVSVTSDTAASRRADQDRSLQAAIGLELTEISGAQKQAATATEMLLANGAVNRLLNGRTGSRPHAGEIAEAEAILAAMRRSAFLPVSAVCIDDAAGIQLACSSGLPGLRFPQAVGRELVAAVGSSQTDVASNPFISPVNGVLSVAYVTPMRQRGRLLGIVHMDASVAKASGVAVIEHAIAATSIELVAYEGSKLQLGNPADRLTRSGYTPASKPQGGVVDVPADGQAQTFDNGGHRAMVAALPLTFGVQHEPSAVVATAVAPNPSLFNSWDPGMLALVAFAALLLVLSLAALTRSYRQMARELAIDPLTRLRNRRALMADLERACAAATVHAPARLWLFDLDGFKRYNDAFGRVAGDTMLERLAQRLRKAMAPYGKVYRVGGDELCVLVRGPLQDPQGLLTEASEVLEERGGAFDITASIGSVSIPRDTVEPTQALLLADQRMYHEKAAKGADATELVTSVLTAALAQRHPDLGDHTNDVAEEVELLAQSVGLDEEAVTLVKAAASLHDIGKLGVPDKIITKPGPLNEQEWEFIKQHTVIGERIIAAAGLPMEGIGPLVRSSHERWDGTGYPDGLTAEEIPLGARIITICDAFGAMVAERVYKPPMSIEDAIEELQRCAGTQFDPHLVDLFCRIVAQRTGITARARDAVR